MSSEHGAHWAALAVEADAWASYLESRGEHGGSYRNKAATYRRTVEALDLEAATGEPHCVCCLKPMGRGGVPGRRE